MIKSFNRIDSIILMFYIKNILCYSFTLFIMPELGGVVSSFSIRILSLTIIKYSIDSLMFFSK